MPNNPPNAKKKSRTGRDNPGAARVRAVEDASDDSGNRRLARQHHMPSLARSVVGHVLDDSQSFLDRGEQSPQRGHSSAASHRGFAGGDAAGSGSAMDVDDVVADAALSTPNHGGDHFDEWHAVSPSTSTCFSRHLSHCPPDARAVSPYIVADMLFHLPSLAISAEIWDCSSHAPGVRQGYASRNRPHKTAAFF